MQRVMMAAASAALLLAGTAPALGQGAAAAPSPDATPAPESSAPPASSAPAATAAPAPAAAPAPLVAYFVVSKKPVFNAQSAGSAEFGLIGAIAAMSSGDKLVKDDNIDDPAAFVAGEIARAFAAKQGGVAADAPIVVDGSTPPASTAHYLVGVVTYTWGYTYYSFGWGHYRAIYGARLTIRDTTTRREIAKGHCFIFPHDQANAPTSGEMLADNAALLKKMLLDDARACVAELEAKAPALRSA